MSNCESISQLSPSKFGAALRQFDESRKAKAEMHFFRNRSSWRELRQIQKEGMEDVRLLSHNLLGKIGTLKQCALAFQVVDNVSHKSEHPINSVKLTGVKSSKQTAGSLACSHLNEVDSSFSKYMTKAARTIENDVLPALLEKLQVHEKDVRKLWEKAKFLFISLISVEARVSCYFAQLNSILPDEANEENIFPLNHLAPPPVSSIDTWLLVAKYSAAIQRFTKISEQINKNFRTLFLIAKELESARIKLVTTFSEKVSMILLECWQNGVLSCKNAMENTKQIPAILNNQSTLGEEISTRLREEEATQGLGTLSSFSSFEYADNQSTSHESMIGGGIFAECMSNACLPLYTPYVSRSFLCGMEDAGIILTSWNPVVGIVTSQRKLHIFSLPMDTDIQCPTVTAYSNLVYSDPLLFEQDILRLFQKVEGKEGLFVASNKDFSQLVNNIGFNSLEDSSLEDLKRYVARTIEMDKFVEPIFSLDLKYCTAHLTPSPIPSENLITITEITPSQSWFSFWSFVEKKVTLKATSQRDALELIGLFKTS